MKDIYTAFIQDGYQPKKFTGEINPPKSGTGAVTLNHKSDSESSGPKNLPSNGSQNSSDPQK